MNESEFIIKLIEDDAFNVSLDTEDSLNIELDNEIVKLPTVDYKFVSNKPQINNVELSGNKSLDELNIQPKGDYPDESLSNIDIENIINSFV